MNRILPALLVGLSVLLPLPAQAAGAMDETTKLRLRCGAGYLLVAADPEMNNTPEEAVWLRQMGEALMIHADGLLQGLGMSTAEREQVGTHYMAEMDAAFTHDLDLGFEPELCVGLVAEAEAAAREGAIDKFMTCGAAFVLAAGIKQEEGDTETAKTLEDLGNRIIGRGENLMIEDGLDDAARYEIGKTYGRAIATKMKAGEDLAYDWDTCAGLDG
ncbi:MAG TPA: hypothetical protein VL133_14160 [Devosia sp.]|nr:hypothetical protein [Devosia sp.]